MATVTLLGIDIGKNTFHLHGQDARGHQVLRKKLNRANCSLIWRRFRPAKLPWSPAAVLSGLPGKSRSKAITCS